MRYSFFDFLILFGSLGLILFGVKIFSLNFQRIIKSTIRKLSSGLYQSKIYTFFNSLLLAGIVQSSAAVTVMIISFANAGLMNIAWSFGAVMGANIGGTITSWLIAAISFNANLIIYAMIFAGMVFPCLFAKKSFIKQIGEAVVGLSLFLVGLSFLSKSVAGFELMPGIYDHFQGLSGTSWTNILLFTIAGFILALAMQSTVVVVSLIFILLFQGWIPLTLAVALIMGENIGNTIIGHTAAGRGNNPAKRVAVFNTLFNLTGLIIALLLFKPFLSLSEKIALQTVSSADSQYSLFALAAFNTFFNITAAMVTLLLQKPFLNVINSIIPNKSVKKERFKLRYINTLMPVIPEIYINEIHRELSIMCDKVHDIYDNLLKADSAELIIKEQDEVIDKLEIEIEEFLERLTDTDLDKRSKQRVRIMLSLANNLQKSADVISEMSENIANYKVISEKEFIKDIRQLITYTCQHMQLNSEEISLQKVYDLENKINTGLEEGLNTADLLNTKLYRLTLHLVEINESLTGLK